jgi:peptide/nickel transport system substrate-binding protein
MNRSGIILFFLFLFLAVIVLFQILGMIQSDRLYERVNRLESVVKSARLNMPPQTAAESNTVSQNTHPGDEGDWLVWCLSSEPENLNPLTSTDGYSQWVLFGGLKNGSVFESLLEYDLDELKLRPLLAEGYQMSDDGMIITFRLRPDVHFSDGVPITTDDIIFTYQTLKNPKIDAAPAANYYIRVKDVVKVDDRTVKFEMSEPYFKALEIAGTLPIIPKHIYNFTDPKQFNDRRSDPVGSGPYVFEKWDVGRQIVVRRNERYWGQRPKLEKIVFRIITNDIAALQSLRSHEVDMTEPTSEPFIELSKNETFKKDFQCLSYWSPMGGYSYIGWNNDSSFFKDKRVRLAMTHMINREYIRQYISKGLPEIVAGPFYVLGKQNDPNIKPWPYDLDKAKQLLDETGWKDTDGDGIRDKDGIPFRFKFMTVSGSPIIERIIRIIKDDAAKIGVDIIIDPYEWSVFLERVKTRQFEAYSASWGGVVEEDPYQIFHSSQIGNRASNSVGFNNPEADKLIVEARQTLDENKRNQLYHRFAQILHEEQPYTFMFTRPELRFIDKRFHNVKIHKLGIDEREWYVPKDLQQYK